MYQNFSITLEFGDILIWTPRDRDPLKVFSSASVVEKLNGKIVIDLNNRDYANEVVGTDNEGSPRWFDTSLCEILQHSLPNARVVKAFNTVAMEALDTSAERLRTTNAQIFLAGNDSNARETVKQLASGLGFECTDLGPGKVAMRMTEALGDVIRFIIIDGQQGGRANICVRTLAEPDLNLVGQREESKYH